MAQSADLPKHGGVNRMDRLQVNKYRPKYTPELLRKAKSIVPRMMGEGAFIEEIAAELDVSKESIYAWCGEHQEFSDIMARGRRLFEAWWIKTGREGIPDPRFNAGQYKWMTMAALDWTTNQKTDTTVDVAGIVQSAAANRIKRLEQVEELEGSDDE